ncbi:MAG: MarR family transcriptional regulator [Myxococcota bacterium]
MTATGAEATDRNVTSLDRCVLRVCDAVGDFIVYWGFKSIHGRIWTLLALHREPLTQAELASRLGVSRALISGTVAELGQWGLVRSLGKSRKAPYEAVIDVWPTISDILRSREWQLIDTARQSLEGAIEEAEVARTGGRPVPYDVGRMKLLLAMTELAQRLLRMIISLRTPSSARRLSSWAGKASSLVRGRVQSLLAERRRS